MTPQSTNVRLYHESLERVTRFSPHFLSDFYYRFISSGDEIANIFLGYDMERIKRKLKRTLELVGDSADSAPGMDMYLELLGRIHSRRHVTPEQFAAWKGALIDTVAHCDPAFDEPTRAAWQAILDGVIEKMHQTSTLTA